MDTNGSGDGGGNGNATSSLNALFEQLRRTSTQESPSAGHQNSGHHAVNHQAGHQVGQNQADDLIAQFQSYHQANQPPYYGAQPQDSPQFHGSFQPSAIPGHMMDSHLPAAPTPPVAGGFPDFQFPPGMNFGRHDRGPPQYNPASSFSTSHVRNDSGDRAGAHLLNLLKFRSQNQESANNPPHHDEEPAVEMPGDLIHAPAAATAPTGLLAALMKGTVKDDHSEAEDAPPRATVAPTWNTSSQSAETQQYLLNLLNRPKPSQSEGTDTTDASKTARLTPKSPTEVAQEPHVPTGSFDFEPPPSSGKDATGPQQGKINTYTNPFEELAASSPLNRTQKTSSIPSAGQSATLPIQILKRPAASPVVAENKRLGSERSPISTPEHTRRKLNDSTATDLSSTPVPEKPREKETVSEAVGDLAERADREAQEALSRAEHEKAQAEIAYDLEGMLKAKSGREFEESAHAAAQAIQKELKKEDNLHILEDALPADVAKAVRDIVDEAAAELVVDATPVADSWESAEADEIVVIEEEPDTPVKVYNFPMKPWISISVQELDKEDTRPLFRDDAIIDIARLKKEFDQVDRNLVTASETYMTYGMSKAGGLRVIRQLDGQDAKLFTDTKDRIFNLALSSTPSDSGIHKESIIGTGISGTVYWVQIKDGEKDHIEDANPEQYGFALPPITSQEGDAPGGVLKTRARASTNHPEYFAVGRGKSINIIWPAFIMKHSLFKPGHDRVVDTEKLSQQCSLKINTGKAGKDFTFSQDDTTVVSLDKSGRVKFWDVRDLTAAEGSDGDSRLPAHTSLEVKEPLMTLNTTLEGEKAWPTSVLLLDKLRPYQKRGALRYMVVGMKQNHTLQLWDLALGKAVQEFNLPHSKESDAVCSVMYHPPTGMIVVGHPTRNSIYFLHLSAPKYSMKTLSQVDYIQRLVAQDSSIPPPESTAVISGLREYSFGNKGILRSLDILPTPTSGGDDQALFELYGMHSKGVTCVVVKQAELGWTKDNKVIDAVDALESGIVKIEPLKSPVSSSQQATEAGAPPQATESDSASTVKLLLPRRDQLHQAATSSTPARPSKDTDEPPTPAPAEKSEKKGRKKKAGAIAGEQQGQSNGSSNSPRVGPSKNADVKGTPSSTSPHAQAQAQAQAQAADSALLEARISSMELRMKEHLTQQINSSTLDVSKKIEASFVQRDHEFEDKFKVLLDMVSRVLNDNTQEVLNHIVTEQFKKTLIPALRDDIAKSISDQVANQVFAHVSRAVQAEVHKSLPGAVSTSLRQPDLVKKISEAVGRNVEETVVSTINNRIAPNLTSVATQASQQVGNNIMRQISEQFGRLEQIQRADSTKLESLVSLDTNLSETVSAMAAAQAEFQAEFLKVQSQMMAQQQQLQQLQEQQQQQQQQFQNQSSQLSAIHQQEQPVQHRHPHPHQHQQHGHQGVAPPPQYAMQDQPQQQMPFQQHHHHLSQGQSHSQVGSVISGHGSFHSPVSTHQVISPPHSSVHSNVHSRTAAGGSQIAYAPAIRETHEQSELEKLVSQIDRMMENGHHDEAMMRWLQSSPHEQELFERVLKKYNPDFIRNLQPLVLLSVGATVSVDLDGVVLREKLAWIEMVLLNFHQLLPSLDAEILQITPKILELIKTRLETIFMRISNTQATDASLKNLAQMIQLITKMINLVKPRIPY